MSKFFKERFHQKKEINYLYFSILFIFLFILILFHYQGFDRAYEGNREDEKKEALLLVPKDRTTLVQQNRAEGQPFADTQLQSKTHVPKSGWTFFFFFYAFGQALFEISLFILIGDLLKRYAPRWAYFSFIVLTFLLMLLHFVQFMMVRLMDSSLLYVLHFFFGSGIDHLIIGFQALNLNWTMKIFFILSIIAFPLLGIGLYWLSSKVTEKKKLFLSLSQIGMTSAVIGTSLCSFDLLSFSFLSPHLYSKYKKILPLGTTFFPPSFQKIHLASALFPPLEPKEQTLSLMVQPKVTPLPNIYIFIIETLRHDFLKEAPYLTHFGNEHIQFSRSYANGNATHLSWFSIFHARFPIYWTSLPKKSSSGSLPLQLLKKMGYQISVFSSADLRFFQMDQLLFGKHRELVDHIEEYAMDRTLEPCDRDALVMKALETHLHSEGNVYLIFLDSTHSEYSIPKDFSLKYEPILKKIDYFTIGPKKEELEWLKNRYRNAISYVDGLIGNFFKTLKEQNLYEEAILIVTGDHGEEFFEEGALFHGTHLNEYQTAVPILMKFPDPHWTAQKEQATHIDLFPSIFHYLHQEDLYGSIFNGRSVFLPDKAPYRIAFLQNGPGTPFEFLLEKEHQKLHGRLLSPSTLEIIQSNENFE